MHIEGYANFEKEKPIGALLIAMQAVCLCPYLFHSNLLSQVGRALEIWKDGEKSLRKPPAFSCDNYGDTFVNVNNGAGKSKLRKVRRATLFVPTLQTFDNNAWEIIISTAREYLPESKKRRNSSASSTTVAADAEEFDDPDADFLMVL